jgi:uncharacterized protein
MAFPPEVWATVRRAYGSGGGCHDNTHVERVYRLAMHIGRQEHADLNVLGLAALFHDIGRPEEEASHGQRCHAEVGAEKARVYLRELGYDAETIERVAACIAEHRFRKRKSKRQRSLESKCLFDADKLDSLGAVGVARAYLWLGERGGTVYRPYPNPDQTEDPHGLGYCPPEDDSLQREWEIKLKNIKKMLYTACGREMARRRHQTMREFLRTMEQEVQGDI